MKKALALILICIITTTTILAKEYVPGVLLVKLEDGTNIEDILVDIGKEPISYKQLRTSFKPNTEEKEKLYTLRFKDDDDVENLAKRAGEILGVKWAEPNYIENISRKPKIDFKTQWNQSWAGSKILETEYAYIRYIPVQQEDFLVAVIDGGIDYNHKALKDNIYINPNEIPSNGIDDDKNGLVDDYMGYDFLGYSNGGGDNDPYPDEIDDADLDYNIHGTMVAGILGGYKDDAVNFSGVNPDCKILNVKGRVSTTFSANDVALAIRYAVDMGAKVINCSFSTTAHPIIIEAYDYANENKVFVVTSAGNDGIPIDSNTYPEYHPASVVVASHDNEQDVRNGSSSYGPEVDFSAIGTSVFGPIYNNNYSYGSGTSFASPIVAAIISRIWAAEPSLTREEVLDKIIPYTQKLADGGTETGHGKIKAKALAESYVEIQQKYLSLGLGDISGLVELDCVFKDNNLIKKILKYFYYNGVRYSVHKEIMEP